MKAIPGAERLVAPDPLENVLSRLDGVRRRGNQYEARCQAHDDQHASLSVRRGDDGRVLIHCHARCEFRDIIAAVGLREADAFPDRPRQTPPRSAPRESRNGRAFRTDSEASAHLVRTLGGHITRTWVYQDATGAETFRVIRLDGCRGSRPKQYRPLHRTAIG